jgi:hypothetical protein
MAFGAWERAMKVKITIDRYGFASAKSNAAMKINRELGSKATIVGDVITDEEGYDERKVIDILGHERLNYSRST